MARGGSGVHHKGGEDEIKLIETPVGPRRHVPNYCCAHANNLHTYDNTVGVQERHGINESFLSIFLTELVIKLGLKRSRQQRPLVCMFDNIDCRDGQF